MRGSMNELSKDQLKRQDFVDNAIRELLRKINPSQEEIEWNIELIGEIRDVIRQVLVGRLEVANEMTFYPYIEANS